MKSLLITATILGVTSLCAQAQSSKKSGVASKATDNAVKVIVMITRVDTSNLNGKTELHLSTNQYKQPLRVTIVNLKKEQTNAFFRGEHVLVTGNIRLKKGYREIVVSNQSQIKPILTDNVVGSGGFN